MNNDFVKKILITVTIVSFVVSAFVAVSQYSLTKNFSATLFSIIDHANFKTLFGDNKIRILIVAGHEPNAGGADEFKAVKERDLNLQLSELLKNQLSTDSNIEVIMARDENGWNKDLEKYVTTSSSTIMKWVADMKNKMMAKVDAGKMTLINPGMKHNDAASNAVLYLYGTNKWIADKKIDLVLHVHFNNNPKINGKPNYKGYCMYVPEQQYSNSSSSKIFADYLNSEISKIEKPSNMPQEKNTIIEDQELIAVGTYDTLKIPAVVVEYAYIYEPMMLSSSTRNKFIANAASSTRTAIENYITNEFKK